MEIVVLFTDILVAGEVVVLAFSIGISSNIVEDIVVVLFTILIELSFNCNLFRLLNFLPFLNNFDEFNNLSYFSILESFILSVRSFVGILVVSVEKATFFKV